MKIVDEHIFLASEYGQTAPDEAGFHVIPVPYEQTVSYGGGAANGPAAILKASQQLEIFDGKSCPGDVGIHTQDFVNVRGTPETVLERIAGRVACALDAKGIPVILGGEHTVSVGAFRALAACKTPVGIVQFDAHADLRDTYEDSHYSHACVMHRALDMGFPICQIGVRSLSPGEHQLRCSGRLLHFDAEMIQRNGTQAIALPPDFPRNLYITFDVDCLDPSVLPATGTPEPGGLVWQQAMQILERLLPARTIIGFDVVELAPIPGLHFADFTAARLVYNFMGMINRQKHG